MAMARITRRSGMGPRVRYPLIIEHTDLTRCEQPARPRSGDASSVSSRARRETFPRSRPCRRLSRTSSWSPSSAARLSQAPRSTSRSSTVSLTRSSLRGRMRAMTWCVASSTACTTCPTRSPTSVRPALPSLLPLRPPLLSLRLPSTLPPRTRSSRRLLRSPTPRNGSGSRRASKLVSSRAGKSHATSRVFYTYNSIGTRFSPSSPVSRGTPSRRQPRARRPLRSSMRRCPLGMSSCCTSVSLSWCARANYELLHHRIYELARLKAQSEARMIRPDPHIYGLP
jgi:hypothetical protein